jgi:oligosaccharide repeat unit polymerase
MIVTILFFSLFVIYFFLKILGLKFTLLHLLLLGFTLKLVGLYFMGNNSGEYKSFVYFLYFYMSFIMGIFTYTYLRRSKISKISKVTVLEIKNKKYLNIEYIFLTLVLALFIVYHYSVIGIPLFNSEVETLRFQAASSGLFGLPSRIVNYSILFYFIYLLLLFYYSFLNKFIFGLFALLPVSVILFAGFKSSILVILHLLIVTYRFSNIKLRIRYFLYVFIPVFGYVVFVFGQYKTLQDQDFFAYLIERLTIINANTFDYIIDSYYEKYTLGFGLGFLNDLLYPFMKLLGNNSVHTVNTMLSMDFYSVQEGGFSVPVTPSIFGYYFLEFGFIGTLISSFLSGIFYVYIYIKGNESIKIFHRSIFLFTEYMLFISYGSGNPMYVFVNYLIGVLIIITIVLLVKSIRQILAKRGLFSIIYKKGVR